MDSNIENVRAGLKHLAHREVDLVRSERALEAEIAALETTAGAAMVDGASDVTDTIDKVSRVQAELRIADVAIRGCQTRRADAIGRLREAVVADREERAASFAREAAELARKVEKHKTAVAGLLGCEVGIEIVRGPSRLQQLSIMQHGLALQIDPATNSGSIDLESVATAEDVAIAALSTDRIAPSADSIIAWFESCEDSAGQPFGNHQRTVHVAWRDSQIDLDESFVSINDFMTQSGPISIYSGKQHIDTASGIFRGNGKPRNLVSIAPPAPDPPRQGRGLTYAQIVGQEARPPLEEPEPEPAAQ